MKPTFLTIFILVFFVFTSTAQLLGKYCAGKAPYVSGCFIFSDGDRFEYYSSGQNGYSTGKGIYTINGDTLELVFKTDSLIGNPFVIKTSECIDSQSTIIVKSIDYESGETTFGEAYVTNSQDSAIGGDVIDINGDCNFRIPKSNEEFVLHLRSTGFKRYSMGWYPTKTIIFT